MVFYATYYKFVTVKFLIDNGAIKAYNNNAFYFLR